MNLKKILDFEYANEAHVDDDVRDALADVVKDVITENYDKYVSSLFEAVGGVGDSCGVQLELPLDYFIGGDTGSTEVDKRIDEEVDYMKETYNFDKERENPDYNAEEDFNAEDFDEYFERYEDDAIRYSIGIELNGEMSTGSGWAWNAVRISSIDSLKVFSSVAYRSAYRLEAVTRLYEGEPIPVTLSATSEGLTPEIISALTDEIILAAKPVMDILENVL